MSLNHIRLVGFNPYDISETPMSTEGVSDPCTDVLSDLEYLDHMIPHHQVAIDMSTMMMPHTQNPQLLQLCRQIIQIQGYEIWEMNLLRNRISDTISDKTKGDIYPIQTKLERYAPKMSSPSNGVCDPRFFRPSDHMQHMKDMEPTQESYLKHMIPHHQVAIDMSRRLLLHTTHSYMLAFCRNLIIEQQGEIYYMNNMLQNQYNYQSELL